MFEFDRVNSLLAEENERKPNQYVAKAMWIGMWGQLLCLFLNEIGLFHLDKPLMRVCVLIGVLCALVPQVIVRFDALATNRKSRYFMLACVCAMSFLLSLALFLFVAPMAYLPMLLAVQYNSKRMSRWAIAGSCLCVGVAPPLGCALGFWDTEFLRFLISSAKGAEAIVMLKPATGIMDQGVLGVVFYLSFPWLLLTLMLGHLILSATQKGEENIQHQIKVLKMSRMDALTGLYNQNVYKEFLSTPLPEGDMGVLFFDVDGLKATNDAKGHEHGDLLLQRCAESLRPLFDDDCHGFRIGGDEFVVVVDTQDPNVVEEKLEQWRESISRINDENSRRYPGVLCHMSVGTSFGPKYDLDNLLVRADKRMYREKQAYHRALAAMEEEEK